MVIDRLLAFSDVLKHTYNYFHDLQDAFRQKDCDEFFRLIRQMPDGVDEEFKEKIQNLSAYETGIKIALTYPKLEAKNTHIKTLKRISYGFKSFSNMRTRIFMMNQLIEIK